MNGSLSCRQELLYLCRRARLLNTPARQDEPFLPFSWWVSRHNEPMDYWGGSQPGSRKCQCGITNTCVDPTKDCNCDAGNHRPPAAGQARLSLSVKRHVRGVGLPNHTVNISVGFSVSWNCCLFSRMSKYVLAVTLLITSAPDSGMCREYRCSWNAHSLVIRRHLFFGRHRYCLEPMPRLMWIMYCPR